MTIKNKLEKLEQQAARIAPDAYVTPEEMRARVIELVKEAFSDPTDPTKHHLLEKIREMARKTLVQPTNE